MVMSDSKNILEILTGIKTGIIYEVKAYIILYYLYKNI